LGVPNKKGVKAIWLLVLHFKNSAVAGVHIAQCPNFWLSFRTWDKSQAMTS